MKVFKQSLLTFLVLIFFWILLAGIELQELLVGAFKSIIYFIRFIFVFSFELIKSNLDVAFRVVNPKLPINPGIVKVKTKLKSRLGRIILANSITLTPGTLTVETDGEDYYIHWIDVSSKNIDDATQKIVSKFEKYLEVCYG